MFPLTSFIKLLLMRKTKNLVTTVKALLLVFALSFLCTIQTNAQSRSTPSPDISPQETTWTSDFANWDFFGWLKTIVTLDMSRSSSKPKPGLRAPINTSPDKKRDIGSGPLIIVTPDMTVRDPD